MFCRGWPGLEGTSPKPRGFLHFAQSSPGHPIMSGYLAQIAARTIQHWHMAKAIHHAAQSDVVVVTEVAQIATTIGNPHC